MSSVPRLVLMAAAISLGVIIYVFFIRKPTMLHALVDVKSSADAIALFPTSVSQIKSITKNAIAEAKKELEKIIAIPNDERTYENTIGAFDRLASFSNVVIAASSISTLELVHPDEAIRNAARATVLEVHNFFIEYVSSNKALYEAIKSYADGNARKETLTDEQKYFIEETIKDFKRSGLDLPAEQLEKVKKIKKELANLEQEFDKNIAQDKTKITVDKDGLSGLSDDFIKSLTKTDEGAYLLGIDYPTYTQVMDNGTNALTRKQLWEAYNNRAYPINKKVLKDIIAKRSELAQLLGFKSYAALELEGEMVKTPQRAEHFLDELNKKARKKLEIEFKEWTQKLPPSVTLANGKINQWDVRFLCNQYKKTTFDLDENKVAEYFPMQNTVDKLLQIYQDFLSLTFNQLPASGLWHQDAQLIEVIDNTSNQTIGYLFLDLYPRDNKYNHACEHTVVPVSYLTDGTPNIGVVIVVANFPKPTADKPSLLHLKDVNTFFHEFGHAMHALLGRSRIASFAGTSVKRDFVEMPSQMLEEWLWDPAILTMVSKQYQTGQPLPADLIATILKARRFDSGYFIVRQIYLAKLALNYFNDGPHVDVDDVLKKLYQQIMYGIQFDPVDHNYTAFGHLTGYGARYYGYMWSKVFAHDLFNQIKKEGLLNPVVGRRYIDTVIGRGGSQDPNILLKNFLGREPKQDAFLHDMGLSK